MSTNRKRALWAQSCLEHLAALTGVDDSAEAVGDLVANLGHYCQAKGLDYFACLKTGISHWLVEQIDPDYFGQMPSITITVNESTTYAD